MREIDRLTSERYAVPSLLLMEAAANAAARAISSRFSQGCTGLRVLILCGRGNNGGDGAALARALWMSGASVDVLLLGRLTETQGDARTNFEIVQRLAATVAPTSDVDTAWLSFKECPAEADWGAALPLSHAKPDVIVDALYGTGLSRPLEGINRQAVEFLSLRQPTHTPVNPRPLIVSLDLPSGLDADAADPVGVAVRADLTITFTAPKVANVIPPAADFNGALIIADIGSPRALLDEAGSQLFLSEATDARQWLEQTRYRPGSFKNTHGHALIIAGSRRMSGAAILCGESALRSGAGLVTVATPASALPAVAARVMPEVMTASLPETNQPQTPDANSTATALHVEAALEQALELAARADVIAIGPGLTSGEEMRRFVRAIVEHRTAPLVVDADGLNALAPWPADLRGTRERPLILTPHPGEMRRLTGADTDQTALADRVRLARGFAIARQVILVLKGARTLIAAPDGRIVINPTGNPGVGTAGAGDTLTGIIAGFNAQAYGALGADADPFAATVAAVYLAGLAGDLAAQSLGMRALVASDISQHFGAAILKLSPASEQP